MESPNNYLKESSLNVCESNVKLENESSDFYQISSNEKHFNSSELYNNFSYVNSQSVNYGHLQHGLLVPSYGYYGFDGNFYGNYNQEVYLPNDYKEVTGMDYYAQDFNLPIHPSAFEGYLGTDVNYISTPEYSEDLTHWVSETSEESYYGHSEFNMDFHSNGLPVSEDQTYCVQSLDSNNYNYNSSYYGSENVEPNFFPQQQYAMPYNYWFSPEVPGYYGYQTYDHTIGQD